jgi:hypothetical protein
MWIESLARGRNLGICRTTASDEESKEGIPADGSTGRWHGGVLSGKWG